MPTFLWSGKDAEGRQRSERVDADNAQLAKVILAGRGWTDLELVKDEIGYSDALHIEPPEWMKEEFEEHHTPEKEAEFFQKKSPGLLAETWAGIKRSLRTILISAALLGWGIYSHRKWPVIAGAIGLTFSILLTPALHFVFSFFGRSRREYSRLNKAKVWARWTEVLECVEELRKADRLTGAAVPEYELVRCRSQALAALGRLPEGVAEFQKLENAPKVEHWFYLTGLAAVYDSGLQFEKGLELRRQAAEEKPETSAVWIDVAYAAVRRLNRPAEARAALARAEQLEITGLGKPYLFFLYGIILWREHKPAEAKEQLEQALAGFQPLSHHDLVEGLLLLTKAYLSAVNGELGNRPEARKLFNEAEKFLVAHREEELLQACRSSLLAER